MGRISTSTKTSTKSMSKDITEKIQKKAYELYLKSGCVAGRDMNNWLEAERIVRSGRN